jgi:glycosyltransferase involved in cell wall biosynthesis
MQTKPPRVTITIPTYNRAHLLSGVIDSVLIQSFRDFELFVSDNASSDETPEVVASFQDSRIHYLRNETNMGPLPNLSRGFRLGSAPYVTVLQDDDLMLSDNLKRKVQVLDDNIEVDWVHSAFRRIVIGPGDAEVVDERVNWVRSDHDLIEPGAVVVRRLLTEPYFIPYSGSLFRRSIVHDECFDPADGLADDLGLALRVAHRSRAVAFIADPLFVARFHPEAHSAKQGVIEITNSSYRASLAGLRHIKRVNERFLVRHAQELEGLDELRGASRRWLHQEIMFWIKAKSGRDRSFAATCRSLIGAVEVDPRILLDRRAARLLLSNAAGTKGRALARRLLARRTEDGLL